MLDALTDALGYVGSSLDKAGPRPLRGLLAGKPRELASIVPFSDELGLTDPHDITSGRDITDQYGWTRKGADDASSHAMGMLTEALIDPIALSGTVAAGIGGLRKAGLMSPMGIRPPSMATLPDAGDLIARELSRLHPGGMNAVSRITPADYASMMTDEANPLGRLHALGRSAGVKVFPDAEGLGRLGELGRSSRKDPQQMLAEMISGEMEGSKGALAVYNPRSKAVTANVIDHPGLWSDLPGMADEMGRRYSSGWLSTAMPEHLAVHELGHALHPKVGQQTSWGGLPGVGDSLERVYPDIWNKIEDEVSTYGGRNPREFVAEAFAKRANVAAQMGQGAAGWPRMIGGQPPWLSLDPYRLYSDLAGPNVPPELLRKLAEYLGESRPGGVGRRVIPVGDYQFTLG